MAWLRASAALALLGATLGSALDAIHTYTRTTAYAHPISEARGAPAWWTFPLFAGAALALGLARPLAERALGRRDAPPPGGAILAAMAVFVGAYAMSGTLPGGDAARAAALAASTGVALFICDRATPGLALALATLAGAGGTLAEIHLISQGAFRYVEPHEHGVPVWLPFLYATGSVAVGAVGRRLVQP